VKTFFVRHAESTAQAHADRSRNPPLSENGFAQAKALTIKADMVICSPMQRTQQTVFNSSRTCTEILFTETCREIRQGNPCDYFERENIELHETRFQTLERIEQLKSIVESIRSKKPDAVICIVSHNCFVGMVTGVWLDNCQMVEIDW
jgi:broad specificity phosphatase PhoE